MKVLVAYASRHGATEGIAQRIADVLRRDGLEVDLQRADRVGRPGEYDAFVIGGCAYMFRWASEAAGLVRRSASVLARRPTWLFSSGPLGPNQPDELGRDPLETAVPREFAELDGLVHPRGRQVFFGAYDPLAKPKGLMERVTRLMPAVRDALPAGDFRDWAAIEAWAHGVAADLRQGGRDA